METHQEAGRRAAQRLGADSVIAGDVIEALPAALRGSRPPRSLRVRAIAHIDLGAVERNCATLARRAGDARSCVRSSRRTAMGTAPRPAREPRWPVARQWLAVATAAEAAALRDDGVTAPLLVMGALIGREVPAALAAGADVVAWTEEFVEAVAAGADPERPARVHVKLDSGMGRLGAKDPEQARALVAAVSASDRLELAGVMTHFATADEADSGFFDEQLARFLPFAEEVKGAHPAAIVHAANSAATLRSERAHFDMVRCGVAVYGLDPFGEDPRIRELEPALSLQSYVAAVKEMSPGEPAGYGRTWSASAPTRIAVLPIGYGDGYRRGLGNRADVLIRGRRHPVVGTVSMDNITVDVGDADVAIGDVATLIGADGTERVSAEELARLLDTINYEVTCGISARVPRVHHPA